MPAVDGMNVILTILAGGTGAWGRLKHLKYIQK
jgi:hypothetical protein